MPNQRSRYMEAQPGLGGPSDIPPTTGKRFYVDSGNTNASTGAEGTTEHPMSTLASALDKCTASQGDQIILMPGHAEDLSADQSLDVAGVSIFGLGEANNRPIFTYTGTAGAISFDAENVRLSNVVLLASTSEVVLAIDVQANYATIDHCLFDWDETNDEFDTMIDVQGYDYCKILHNEFRGDAATAGADNCLNLAAAEYIEIGHNHFSGQWNACIVNAGTASVQMNIHDNTIYNADTSDNSGVEITVASTGLFARNLIGSLYATGVANALDPGSLLCLENYAVNAINETGVIVPATTAS